MSKRTSISRYSFILKKLQLQPNCTFKEIMQYVEREMEDLFKDDPSEIAVAKRTLQRDLKDLREVFNFNIEHSKKTKGYSLKLGESENQNFLRIVESFDTIHSLNMAKDVTPFLHLEKRRFQTEHLSSAIRAIKNRQRIKFTYHTFWNDEITHRDVAPYALKEFKNRWYVLAKGENDVLKTFALDRISELVITKTKFSVPKEFSIKTHFKHSFGIMIDDDSMPQEITLSFTKFKGNYIKSLPLHDSQIIVADNENELLIKLTVCITHDFMMELLSHGEELKVIQPKSLIKKVKAQLKNALAQYS